MVLFPTTYDATLGIIILVFILLVHGYALYLSAKSKHYVWTAIILANLALVFFTPFGFPINSIVPVGYYFIQKFQKSKKKRK